MAGSSSRAASTIAVLMGGPSAEREVSLVSGHACATALREAGYTAVEVDCGLDLAVRLSEINPDVCFNALHGRWGEDGAVQGILEWLRIPYTHSGILASALAMDKARAKQVFAVAGLPIVQSVLVAREEVARGHVLTPPYVVKPNNEGSSVGVYIVREGSNAPRMADTMPDLVMVETYAPGRELTVTVMGDRALCVTDILTEGWYDYDSKYKTGGSRHVVPAKLPTEITDACLEYALRAHVALGCRGLSRTDFRWDETRGTAGLILLETNTQPGMTSTSLAPEQAAFCGISFLQLVDWMVKDASCNR
jgi:D-alanine-D-alanine ligase